MAHAPTLGREAVGSGAAAGRKIEIAREILSDIFGRPEERRFSVRLWNGFTESPAGGPPPLFTLVIKRSGALRRMFLPPSELALAQAYVRDDVDVEGDLEAAAQLTDALTGRFRSPMSAIRVLPRLLALGRDRGAARGDSRLRSALGFRGRKHSLRRDAGAVRFHYDVGNDFYALWLDRRMVYSCAYFTSGLEDIDAAQAAKLEHICRKLRLESGERLLDIGCGWGGLVQYAAERYGVEALGVTLSQPQADLARARLAAAGLSGRCRVEVRDYRDLADEPSFDKVVSVGMVEHVGRSRLTEYFAAAHRLTRPGGLFLNQGIVAAQPAAAGRALDRLWRRLWREGAFRERYVFPDGELLPLVKMIGSAESAGFETRDVESLREHYVLTLRHWVQRLEARCREAVQLVGEATYRTWRLYMAGAARAFAAGKVGVVQMLLSRPDGHGGCSLPLTRADLYRDGSGAAAREGHGFAA